MQTPQPTPRQAEILQRLKTGAETAAIPITNDAGHIIGALRPIDRAAAEDPEVVNALYRWRAAAPGGFLTVFEPTPEKTSAYLQRLSLPDPGRILFLIEDADRRRVGNIGLCNISENSAEVDNVVRGEPAAPGFMAQVQMALIGWTRETLGADRVYLNVLSDNERAIASYRKAGYVETDRVRLRREDTADGYRLVPDRGADARSLSLVRMEAPS